MKQWGWMILVVGLLSQLDAHALPVSGGEEGPWPPEDRCWICSYHGDPTSATCELTRWIGSDLCTPRDDGTGCQTYFHCQGDGGPDHGWVFIP